MKSNKKTSSITKFIDLLLKEDNFIPEPQSSFEVRPVEQQKDISLDQVIDRYIIQYEKESIPTIDSYENEMFENYKFNFDSIILEALNEADNDEENQNDEENTDSANSGSDDTFDSVTDFGGSSTKKNDDSNKQAIINTPQINLQEFGKNIARLVNNFDTLLNPRDTILNRVENYIKINYDERTAKELMELLSSNYSLRTQEKNTEENNAVPNSYSVGALSTEG